MDVLDPVFPLQVRAARTLLGWSQRELAERAGVSEPFINRLERGRRLGHAQKLAALRDALLRANVSFFSAEHSFGVVLGGSAAELTRRQWAALREDKGSE